MAKAEKTLEKMRANPKADWSFDQIKALSDRYGIVVRQRGTSHAVLTYPGCQPLTIPTHKPIKPVYIRRFVELVATVRELD